jgi:SAM-dependent methyltransferase
MFSKAEAYDRFMGRWSRRLAPALIAFAGVREGDAVLDVGAGTGELARAVCTSTRAGRVVGIDPSPELASFAAASSSDPRVRFEVGDGQALPLPARSFDRTLSLFALNFIPDPTRAIREMVRVTRPGGVVAAAVWDYAGGMQMLRASWDEAIALDPAIEPRDEAHMPLCKPGELAAAWTRHGFEDVEDAALTVALPFASFDDYWRPFLLGQGPAGAYVAGLPGARQAELARRLLGDVPDGAIDLHARAWAVKGVVPPEPVR